MKIKPMEKENLPTPYETVMVTYKKDGKTITKKGFYSCIFNEFSIPDHYYPFTFFDGQTVDLPHGFNGDRLGIEDVINWESIKQEKT